MCFLSQLTFEWRSRFPTCTGPLRVPLTMLFYWGEKRDRAYNAERDNYVNRANTVMYLSRINLLAYRTSPCPPLTVQLQIWFQIKTLQEQEKKKSPLLSSTLFQNSSSLKASDVWLSVFVYPCSAHLNVFAVMASCWKLYTPESDWTFEGNLNGRLLHAVLPVERRVARWCCYAAEVPLNFDAEGEKRSA